jgi:small-conductance mechanosensitive channel
MAEENSEDDEEMSRPPLWRDLRGSRRRRLLVPVTTVPPPPRPRYGIAIASSVIAIAALTIFNLEGGSLTKGATTAQHIWAGSMAGTFLVFGSLAVRRLATQLGRLVHVGGGPTAGSAIRLIFTIAGLILVVVVTIGMLGVQATRLLAAAGITGVILGLAAQQSLGNVFAGIVLMVARPFNVGERIRIRSGSFGGIFDAEVQAMGLTYVDLVTDEGPLKIPNLGMLAAGVGPAPEPSEGRTPGS